MSPRRLIKRFSAGSNSSAANNHVLNTVRPVTRGNSPKINSGCTALRSGIERMFTFFVNLFLQLQALVISLGGARGLCDRIDPGLHFEFSEFAGRQRTVARIMIGKSRVPPD